MRLLKKAFGMFKENRFDTGIFLVTMLVAFLPLFTVNCIGGHDIDYHLLRIESLKEGILMGCPFLRINVLFFGGRGYASSLFYPDFLLYFPALLRAAGLSVAASYHLFIALCILLAYLAMYFCTKLMTGNRYAACMAAVIYTLSQYHLHDIYTRSAVGEYTAFIFLPFLLYGLYEMVIDGIKRPYMPVIGFSGVLLCHTNTTVFCIGLFVVAFVIALPRLWKNKQELGTLIAAAIAVLVLTAFYWVPVLEMFMKGSFQTGAGGFDLNYEKLLLKDLVKTGFKGLGGILLIPCLARFLLSASKCEKEEKQLLRYADLCMIAGLLFCLGCTGLVPWGRLQNILGFVQFPWRLLIMATALLSMSGALYLWMAGEQVVTGVRGLKVVSLVVCGAMILSAFAVIADLEIDYYSYSNDYYDHIPFTGSVIGGEWLPAGVTDRDALLENCDLAYTSDGSEIPVVREQNRLTVSQIPSPADGYVDVPFVFYPGYTATDENGHVLTVSESPNNAQCRVYLDGDATSVLVFYKGTSAQKFSMAVSVLCLMAAAFGFVLRWRKKVEKFLKEDEA